VLREIFVHFSAQKSVDAVDHGLGDTKLLSLAQWLAACEPMINALHTFTRIEASGCCTRAASDLLEHLVLLTITPYFHDFHCVAPHVVTRRLPRGRQSTAGSTAACS
jgi:hypothetical protein